jgi:uncharacterized protein YdbL (DUF1318 family)
MHNLDRTQTEYEWGPGEFEFESDRESYGETYGEYGETYGEYGGSQNESFEMEMAAELLGVSSEQELDHFLGGLFKKVTSFIPPSVRGALGGVLKNVAKAALPMVGSALGSVVPGVGTAIGGALGSAAGRMFGLELEGMSGEDQEFEVAQRVVRFATEAAQQAAQQAAAAPNASPQQIAQSAATAAAQRVAPGLLNSGVIGAAPGGIGRSRQRGMWIRKGNKIILFGVGQ